MKKSFSNDEYKWAFLQQKVAMIDLDSKSSTGTISDFSGELKLRSVSTQIMFMTEDEGCSSIPKLIFQIVQPIYVLMQLYMMFKFSNVIVNRSKGMARLQLQRAT